MQYSARDVVRHFTKLEAEARQLLAGYQQFHAWVEAARQRVAPVEAQARMDLAAAYLAEMSRPAIQRLERLTGFKGLSRRNPLTAMAREAKVLETTIARIRVDERYVRRQYLVGPEGEITRALAEARDMLEPWQEAVDRFEKLEGFLGLVEVGYDTPRFDEHFWQASYWKHWAAGDRICEALGLGDFGDDVLPAWREACSKRDPWLEEVRRIEARAQEVHDLVREHDQAVARLSRLPEIYLDASLRLVAEFLASADYGLLDEWIRKEGDDARPVRMGLRRAAGLKAKLDVLGELSDQGVAPVLEQLHARIAKYTRKIAKYSRPKYSGARFPESVLDRGFEAKAPALAERTGKLAKLVEQVERYDDYERFDMSNAQELWFAEFTGRVPPAQLPRLRGWYARQGEIRVAHDTRDQERAAAQAVAVAAAARELDEAGYLS